MQIAEALKLVDLADKNPDFVLDYAELLEACSTLAAAYRDVTIGALARGEVLIDLDLPIAANDSRP